ncbi:MAG: ATP-dependent metalloprotease FtsH [Verrucomicrobiales bacterium]|nr:ATP-dependent metalloprotease FtsH [Verrucomicrobiales bacterium]
MKISRGFRLIIGGLVCLAVTALFVGLWQTPATHDINRGQFELLLKTRMIKEASLTPTLYQGIYEIAGTYNLSPSSEAEPFNITTRLEEAQVHQLMNISGVRVDVPGKSNKAQAVNIISTVVVAGMIVMLIVHQSRMSKTTMHRKVRTRPSVRFKDVAGIDEAKSELSEVVDFLKHPRKYKKLGGKLPKGVLLVGPPGTGKTMLAKAIAGEANASFYSVHGSDFNEIYVGVGAKRIRELFRQAGRSRPAIIFIDEIDCLGKSRKYDTNGEMQQTNNALLAAMDGFEGAEGIVVIAATNRPEDLDEALTRPGRFDRKVHVGYPDIVGRRAILHTHASEMPIREVDRCIDVIAKTTPGMSGADLANLLNEAAILCAQQNSSEITLRELEASRDKLRYGMERKSMVMNPKEREMVAYHEAGHTIINLQKKLLAPLYKVSIIPRGQALGVTTLLPIEDQNLHSKELLLEQLVVLMGGRAAEKLFYGATTNGANGDLDMAKSIARRMVHDWGMGKKMYYEAGKLEAEAEINRFLEEADREALEIIKAQHENTMLLAKELLVRETLNRDEVLALLKNFTPGSASHAKVDYSLN